jgi:hypothetical protein
MNSVQQARGRVFWAAEALVVAERVNGPNPTYEAQVKALRVAIKRYQEAKKSE